MSARAATIRGAAIAAFGLWLFAASAIEAEAADHAEACIAGLAGVAKNPLAWEDAIDLALCHNAQLQGSWAAIKIQAAAVGEARAASWPSANISAGELADRTRYPGSNQAATSLRANTLYASLGWRLFDFGGRDANRRVADYLLEAAQADHRAAILKTTTRVIDAYFGAQTAKASWQAKQQNEDLALRTLQTAQRRERQGTGSRTEGLQADAALAKVSLEKSRARGTYQKAISLLIYTMGLPAVTPIVLSDEAPEPVDALRRDLDAWLRDAADLHPAIRAARAQLAGAKAKVELVRSEGLPTLDLAANIYQNGRPNQGLTPGKTRETLVGVTLSIPLFEGFARGYKERGAEAQVDQQEAALRDVEDQILMEVVKAHSDAMSALENLSASQRLLTAAEDALASVARKFDKGAADIVEILSSQAVLSDAQEERIRCLAEWRSARWRLLADVGHQCTRFRSVCEGDSPNLSR